MLAAPTVSRVSFFGCVIVFGPIFGSAAVRLKDGSDRGGKFVGGKQVSDSTLVRSGELWR